MNIKVLNISNNNNMGDIIIGETAVFLANIALTELGTTDAQVDRIEVIPVKADLLKHHFLSFVFGRAIQEFSYLFLSNNDSGNNSIHYKIFNLGAKIKATGYYKEQFKQADAIIIAEGALKYSLQDFSYYFDIITRLAAEMKIPVMLNAMSIERANPDDYRYRQLKKAVNKDSVKMITTRDGEVGIDVLMGDYQIPSSKCNYVGDTAFWIPECYNINKSECSSVYGIGIMAPDVFVQNGFDLPEDCVKQFYIDLISILLGRHIHFKLFTNGLGGDYDFATSLVDELHLERDVLLAKPMTPLDFIEMISGFKAIVGARMHACITAFSLEVPVVGLIWHDKLKTFASTMKLNDYFFDSDHLDARTVVSKLMDASYTEEQLLQRTLYKNRTKQSIYDFLSRI